MKEPDFWAVIDADGDIVIAYKHGEAGKHMAHEHINCYMANPQEDSELFDFYAGCVVRPLFKGQA